MKKIEFSFDSSTGEYVAYSKQFPEVASMGKTKKEARLNLIRDIKAYITLKQQ